MSSSNPNVSGTSTISQLAQLVTNLQNTITNVSNSNVSLSNSIATINNYDISNTGYINAINTTNATQDGMLKDLSEADNTIRNRIQTLENKFPINILNDTINISLGGIHQDRIYQLGTDLSTIIQNIMDISNDLSNTVRIDNQI